MSNQRRAPAHRRKTSPRGFTVRRLIAVGVGVLVLAAVVTAGIAISDSAGPTKAAALTSTTLSTSTTSATDSSAATSRTPVTFSFVGDMDLGNTPQLPPSPATYLAAVTPALKADVVFGNLEGTLTNSGADSKCSPVSTECYAFRNPTSFASIYRTDGFTVINSANNHSDDFGLQGQVSTSAALRAAGLVQAGLPGQIGIVTVGSTKVAFVDFAPYTSTNDMLNPTQVAQLIHRARNEAPIVVAYMHSGAEGESADHVTGQTEYYVGENRGNPEAFAKSAIDDGADLVVASGPHTLRGMEFYKGHLIAYSLGDFASYYNFATIGTLAYSGILHVTLSPTGSFDKASFTSVNLSVPGQPSLQASDASAQFVAQLSAEDFGSAAARISPHGTIVP
jgi:poly-gamma-glutamate capsule biosynthesis protein CapA/YwtB (metallophosphatase superfamily)